MTGLSPTATAFRLMTTMGLAALAIVLGLPILLKLAALPFR